MQILERGANLEPEPRDVDGIDGLIVEHVDERRPLDVLEDEVRWRRVQLVVEEALDPRVLQEPVDRAFATPPFTRVGD